MASASGRFPPRESSLAFGVTNSVAHYCNIAALGRYYLVAILESPLASCLKPNVRASSLDK